MSNRSVRVTPWHNATREHPGEPGAQTPLRDRVRDEIRKAILERRYKAGERLFEERLAEDFHVSRNPIREALRALAAEGLVDVAAWRGASVVQLSKLEALELTEIRASLEGLNARQAARRRDPDQIRRLTNILQDGTAAVAKGRIDILPQLNARFHDTLYEAGRNRALTGITLTLRARTTLAFLPISPDRAQEAWTDHAAILKAVIAGDGELAEILASRHVSHFGAYSLARMPDT